MKRWLQRVGILFVLYVATLSAWEGYADVSEVPAGYRRLDFDRDVTSKIRVGANQQPQFAESLAALDGRSIFLKGWMYPEAQSEGLLRFLLVTREWNYAFGRNPTVAEIAEVKLANGESTQYQPELLSVWGTLRVDRTPQTNAEVISIVDAHCEPARSRF